MHESLFEFSNWKKVREKRRASSAIFTYLRRTFSPEIVRVKREKREKGDNFRQAARIVSLLRKRQRIIPSVVLEFFHTLFERSSTRTRTLQLFSIELTMSRRNSETRG